MTRAPDPLRLIVIAAVLAIVLLRVGAYLGHEPQWKPAARPTGTGGISGVVVDEQGRPLKKITVTLQQPHESWHWKFEATADDGAFTFKELPPGEFTIAALFRDDRDIRSRYGSLVGAGFGQMAAKLSPGQTRDGLRITLVPAGSIEGHVYDEAGQPASKKYVRVIRRDQYFDELRYNELPMVSTDEGGRYRVTGAAPGNYIIMAGFDPLSLRRVYYPDAARIEEARTISVGVGEAKSAIDLHARPILTSAIAGRVVDAAGSPIRLALNLVKAGAEEPDTRPMMTMSSEDGRFSFDAVPADRYLIVAHSTITHSGPAAPEKSGPALWGVVDVTSNGRRPTDVQITVEPGRSISGTLKFTPGSARTPPKPEDITLMLFGRDIRSVAISRSASFSSTVDGQYRFTISGVPPGTYSMRPLLGSDWRFISTSVGGRQLPDPTFSMTRDSDLTGVEIEAADQTATLSGTVRTAAGAPSQGRVVVVFAADPHGWTQFSGRVVAGGSDSQGEFSIGRLIPGDYLVAALSEGSVDQWMDRRVLERLRADAAPVTLKLGERKQQDLTVKR